MKTLVKLLCITVGLLFLCVTCKKNEQDKDTYISYTDCIISTTNSYVQINDSIYNFTHIEGSYGSCDDKSLFYFTLSDSSHNHFQVSILTDRMNPEIFFQKGTKESNLVNIYYGPMLIGGGPIIEYAEIRSVLTWNSVFYEDRIFKGKGSFELRDTLHTVFPSGTGYLHQEEICFPPQKIEFEFK